jgi:hypothetical protein
MPYQTFPRASLKRKERVCLFDQIKLAFGQPPFLQVGPFFTGCLAESLAKPYHGGVIGAILSEQKEIVR